MAGIAGANTVGIARDAKLVSVKVLNNDERVSYEGEMRAYNEALQKHIDDTAEMDPLAYRGSVWLMFESLYSVYCPFFDRADVHIRTNSYVRVGRPPWAEFLAWARVFSTADMLGVTIVSSVSNHLFNADYHWPW